MYHFGYHYNIPNQYHPNFHQNRYNNINNTTNKNNISSPDENEDENYNCNNSRDNSQNWDRNSNRHRRRYNNSNNRNNNNDNANDNYHFLWNIIDAPSETLGVRTVKYNPESMSCKGYVYGKSCNILFDTGSEITLMTKRYFDSLNLNHMIENPRCRRIRAVDNNTIPVFGQITVPISIGKIEITVPFQIIPDIHVDIIFGRDMMATHISGINWETSLITFTTPSKNEISNIVSESQYKTPLGTLITEIFELIEQVSLKIEQLSNSPLIYHPLFEIFKSLKLRMSMISKSRRTIAPELKNYAGLYDSKEEDDTNVSSFMLNKKSPKISSNCRSSSDTVQYEIQTRNFKPPPVFTKFHNETNYTSYMCSYHHIFLWVLLCMAFIFKISQFDYSLQRLDNQYDCNNVTNFGFYPVFREISCLHLQEIKNISEKIKHDCGASTILLCCHSANIIVYHENILKSEETNIINVVLNKAYISSLHIIRYKYTPYGKSSKMKSHFDRNL